MEDGLLEPYLKLWIKDIPETTSFLNKTQFKFWYRTGIKLTMF